MKSKRVLANHTDVNRMADKHSFIDFNTSLRINPTHHPQLGRCQHRSGTPFPNTS